MKHSVQVSDCQFLCSKPIVVTQWPNCQDMLIHAFHAWTKKNVLQNGTVVWRCTGRNAHKCSASLRSQVDAEGDMVRVSMTDHSHAPNPDELIQLRARAVVRNAAAASSCERVQNIAAETVETVPVSEHVALNEKGLRRAAYGAR